MWSMFTTMILCVTYYFGEFQNIYIYNIMVIYIKIKTYVSNKQVFTFVEKFHDCADTKFLNIEM